MFFLLRVVFWLSVVCLLLPSSGSKTSSPQIEASQAVTLASAAISDASGFCERQPEACKVGGKVAMAIGQKAEAGARTLYELVTTKISEKSASGQHSTGQRTSTKAPPASGRQDHSLTQADMAAAWHAPVPLPPRRGSRPEI